jgi:hypothetical protein
MENKVCINCKRTDQAIPLITVTFKGEEKCICPQCFPVLIHKTQQLADQFPGIEIRPPAEH